MGISLHGRGWGCWKSAQHRGKNPARLLAALLHIPYAQAASLLDLGTPLESDDTLAARVRSMIEVDHDTVDTPTRKLRLPKTFLPIKPSRQGSIFIDYLRRERNYSQEQAEAICKRYDLHYSMSGPLTYRIITLVRDRDENLITWTGRTIVPRREPRYMTLSARQHDDTPKNTPIALGPITDYLFNEPQLFEGGDLLIVTEGIFDAIRLDYAATPFRREVHATCLFGKALTDLQASKLIELSDLYDDKVLLLDNDAALDGFRVVERLRPYGFRTARLPTGYKDPDDLGTNRAQRFIISQLSHKGNAS